MANGLSEYELETLSEFESLGEDEFESEFEGEFEVPEMFDLGGIGQWASNTWQKIMTPGTNERRIAIDTDKALISGSAGALGGLLGGAPGAVIGGAAGTALGSALLPPSQYESEFELEGELSPLRRIYADAMMEHLAHDAATAESEEEAAEGFLPLIPLVAGKLLPAVAKAFPRRAGTVLPRAASAISKVSPHLTRGVSNITRTLFRHRPMRPLVRTVPTIARRTVHSLARRAAAGRPVTPGTALRTLQHHTRRVIRDPRRMATTLKRSIALDKNFHRVTGIRPKPPAGAAARPAAVAPGYRPGQIVGGQCVCSACPVCGTPTPVAAPATPQGAAVAPSYCRCCGQLLR